MNNGYGGFPGGRFSQGIPDQRPGFLAGAIVIVCLALSILAWIFTWRTDTDASRLLIRIMIVVSIASLIFNLFLIFRIGYNGFVMNYWVSYLLNVIFSVAGMFLTDLSISAAGPLAVTEWRLLIFILTAALMSAVPTFLISGITWLLMAMFGDI